MSPLIRGILILAVSLIGSFILFLSDKKRMDERYLAILSVSFPFIDLTISAGQIAITPYLLISLVYIAFRIRLVRCFFLRLPVLILIGVMVITTIFSQFKLVSILTVFQRLLLLTPIAASYSLFLKRNVSKTIYRLILPPILYTLFFAFIQILFDPSFTLYYSIWDREEERLSFCYRDPQIAGCVVATLAILLLNLFLYSKKIKYLVPAFILFFVGCFTGSKTFLLGTLLASALSVLRSNFSVRYIYILLFVVLSLSLTYNVWCELPVFQRMTEMDSSIEGRFAIFWLGALEIYLDNPIFGVGPGSFFSYVELKDLPMVHNVGGEYIYASQPESGYLLWLDEYGIFSLALIALLIYVLSRKGGASLNFCVLIPWMICFVSLYNLQYIHVTVLLAIIVGAVFAVHKRVSLYSENRHHK